MIIKNINFSSILFVRMIFVWAIIGMIISAILWYEYSQPGEISCSLTGNGCELVRFSPYSKLFGVSLPVYGFIYYLFTAILAQMFVPMIARKSLLLKIYLVLALIGTAFSIYLTYLELFVIHALCQWCVASALATLGLLISAFLAKIADKEA